MIHPIIFTFEEFSNPKIAKEQSAYLKNKFLFYGLKTPLRRELQRPFLVKNNLLEKEDAFSMVKELWKASQRELHYFGQEYFFKYAKQFQVSDIELIEYLITHNSWWDTIDFIATKPLSEYFRLYPDERNKIVQQWIESGDIWLQRSAVLFQLKYKAETDLQLLTYIILNLNDSKEFFIKKAIGWILREYSRTDSNWVLEFVNKHTLQPLSKREALKLIQTQ